MSSALSFKFVARRLSRMLATRLAPGMGRICRPLCSSQLKAIRCGEAWYLAASCWQQGFLVEADVAVMPTDRTVGM